jgi:hypothetical protein
MAILDVTVHIFPKDHYLVPQNDPNQAWFNLAPWRFKLEKVNDEWQAKIHIPVELKMTVLVFSILYYMFIINKSFFSFENNLEANCMIDVTTKIKLG